MTGRVLIFIEINTSGTGRQFLRTTRDLGLVPILITRDPASFEFLAADGIEAIRVDTGDIGAVIDVCSQLRSSRDVAGIMSVHEYAYAAAAAACRHFGLPGPDPEAIERCRDKFTQRRLHAEAGVPVPDHRLATTAADAVEFAAEIGLPVILKPVTGCGSAGVRLCQDMDEVAGHTNFLLAGKQRRPSPPKVLVEEFAAGPSHFVETFADEVMGIVAAEFTEPPCFTLRDFTIPAPLTKVDQDRVADVVLRGLRALGLSWGPANTEIRLTRRGPVIIEVNPRLSGAPNPEMVRLAYGINLIAATIKVFIGETPDLRKSRSQTAAARFLIPDRDGVLEWIRDERRARAIPGIAEVEFNVTAGMPIVRTGDLRDVIGHVIATSPTHVQTAASLRQALDRIDWSVAQTESVDMRAQPAAVDPIDSNQREASRNGVRQPSMYRAV